TNVAGPSSRPRRFARPHRVRGDDEQKVRSGAADVEARGAEDFGVLVGMANVHECRPATRLQHAGDLADGYGPAVTVVNVMQRPTRKDYVERAIRERQLSRVTVFQLDAVGDALEPRVFHRRR